MATNPSNPTITIGKYLFYGPYPYDQAEGNLPNFGGIYSLLTRDLNGQYNIIYIGQSHNINERVNINTHHKGYCWLARAGSRQNLFVAIRPEPVQHERERIEAELILQYNPPCNN